MEEYTPNNEIKEEPKNPHTLEEELIWIFKEDALVQFVFETPEKDSTNKSPYIDLDMCGIQKAKLYWTEKPMQLEIIDPTFKDRVTKLQTYYGKNLIIFHSPRLEP